MVNPETCLGSVLKTKECSGLGKCGFTVLLVSQSKYYGATDVIGVRLQRLPGWARPQLVKTSTDYGVAAIKSGLILSLVCE